MTIKDTLITKGFIIAGLMNLTVLIHSRLFMTIKDTLITKGFIIAGLMNLTVNSFKIIYEFGYPKI